MTTQHPVPERTRQQLDPSNTLASRRGALVLSIVAVVWSLAIVVLGGVTAASVPFEATSMAVLALAAITMVRACDPLRAPFSQRDHLTVHGMLLLSFLLGVVGQWGDPLVLAEYWAPTAIGCFSVAMSPYRPLRELIVVPLVSSVVIGLTTVVRMTPHDGGTPVIASAVITVLPILAFAFGAARYTQVGLSAVERWHRRSEVLSAGLTDRLAHTIGRTVQRDRASILDLEAAPFLRAVLDADSITDADRRRAGAIAATLREVMVSEADRSWLDELALATPPRSGGRHVVHDPDRLAARMDQRQRSAVRALVAAASDPAVSSPVTFELLRDTGGCSASVSFGALQTTGQLQPALDPYLALMTSAFDSFVVHAVRPTLIVRFSFDHD
ncbi:MAG: hypothetical protein RI885_2603 [Actinomycetota bacterium]